MRARRRSRKRVEIGSHHPSVERVGSRGFPSRSPAETTHAPFLWATLVLARAVPRLRSKRQGGSPRRRRPGTTSSGFRAQPIECWLTCPTPVDGSCRQPASTSTGDGGPSSLRLPRAKETSGMAARHSRSLPDRHPVASLICATERIGRHCSRQNGLAHVDHLARTRSRRRRPQRQTQSTRTPPPDGAAWQRVSSLRGIAEHHTRLRRHGGPGGPTDPVTEQARAAVRGHNPGRSRTRAGRDRSMSTTPARSRTTATHPAVARLR